MHIAFLDSRFPTMSRTFVLWQMIGVLQRGHDISILPREFNPHVPRPEAVDRYELLKRTVPVPIPAGFPKRQAAFVGSTARAVAAEPGTVAGAVCGLLGARFSVRQFHELVARHCAAPTPMRFDVLHAHFGKSGKRAMFMRRHKAIDGPLIASFHGQDVNVLPRKRRYGRNMYRELFHEAELLTVNSRFLASVLIDSLHAPEERVVRLPMGVATAAIPWRPRTRNTEQVRLLTVARLTEVKGIEYAIRAVARLAETYPELRYSIVGKGHCGAQLKRLAAELGVAERVEFHGAKPWEEVVGYFESHDLFVLPSVVTADGAQEAQGVVLLEAQAAGMPVLATRVGGIPESVRDGESAILVAPRDEEALAEALAHLLEHPERWPPMGAAGRAFVEREFEHEMLIDRLTQLYRDVACGRDIQAVPPGTENEA